MNNKNNSNNNSNNNNNFIENLKRRVNNYSSINPNSNFQDNIINDNTKLMTDMIKKYDENTKNKAAIGMEYNQSAKRIIELKNDINRRSSYLRELLFKEGALKEKLKKNIYDNNKYIDRKDIYKIVFGIHAAILIVMLIGFFNLMNSMIVVIVILILYILICGLLLYKFKFDTNRNKFKYKEFDVGFERNNVCSFNPSLQKDGSNNGNNDEKNEKQELKKFTN